MASSWRIVEYRGHGGLRQLEADWKRLLDAMPDRAPQHAWETNVAYFNHLSRAEGRFACFALTDGERVRAICPLEPAALTIFGRPAHACGLACDLFDLNRDVVCPPDEARRELLPCLVRFLRDAPDAPAWLVFDRVVEGSVLWDCLRSLHVREYCTDVVDASDSIDCQRPFEELRTGLSKNFRRNLRKAHNKLAALPDVRFVHASDPLELEREFATFLEVEASGWKGEAGTRGAVRAKPIQMAFYRNLVATLIDGGQCEINALYAEGRCIASQLCVRSGTEYAIPKIGYDERYARVAPGQLLLEWTLKRCCRDPQIARLNLVSGAAWHRDWRTNSVPVHCAYLALGQWSGPPLLGLLRLRLRYGPRVKAWLLRSRVGSRIVRRLRPG
jgi:hypothetical protein